MASNKNRVKKNTASGAVKTVIVVVIMAALIVLAYYRMNNTTKGNGTQKETSVAISAVDEVLMRDLDRNYPPSPKEVVKYYSELTKAMYNSDLTDEQIEALGARAMELYDPELAANQQWNRYIADLKSEIASKRSQEYAIMSYSLSASTDVVYFSKNGYECASLYCTYNIRNGSVPGSVMEQFILRQDENEHWRILGWVLPDDNKNNTISEQTTASEEEQKDNSDPTKLDWSFNGLVNEN